MEYIKIIDGIKSNAGGFEYIIDKINIAKIWNPKANTPEEMGGFSFSNEANILRWLIRGSVIYDVTLPTDAEVVKINHKATPNGVFRSNKIILSNPRNITDEMALEFYYKSDFPEKTFYKALAGVAIKGYHNTANQIIIDKVNNNNIDEVIREYLDFYQPSKENANEEHNNYFYYLDKLKKYKI